MKTLYKKDMSGAELVQDDDRSPIRQDNRWIIEYGILLAFIVLLVVINFILNKGDLARRISPAFSDTEVLLNSLKSVHAVGGSHAN
jgi:hypothetical protein